MKNNKLGSGRILSFNKNRSIVDRCMIAGKCIRCGKSDFDDIQELLKKHHFCFFNLRV